MSTCQQCAEKDRQIAELEDALTNERAGVSQHKAEADLVRQDMGEKLAEAKRQIADLDASKTALTDQVSIQCQTIFEANQRISDLERTIAQHDEQWDADNDHNAKRHEEATKRIVELEESAKQREGYDGIAHDFETAKKRITELDEQRRLAVNQRDNAERNQEVVSKQNAMLRERIAELESETCVLRDSAAEMVKSIIDADGDDIPVTVAQFETLTKRRDGQRYLHKVSSLLEHITAHQKLFEDVCRGAAKDKERVAVLEAALSPFANFGAILKTHKPSNYPDILWQYSCGGGVSFSLLQSELKAAHDALEGRS